MQGSNYLADNRVAPVWPWCKERWPRLYTCPLSCDWWSPLHEITANDTSNKKISTRSAELFIHVLSINNRDEMFVHAWISLTLSRVVNLLAPIHLKITKNRKKAHVVKLRYLITMEARDMKQVVKLGANQVYPLEYTCIMKKGWWTEEDVQIDR